MDTDGYYAKCIQSLLLNTSPAFSFCSSDFCFDKARGVICVEIAREDSAPSGSSRFVNALRRQGQVNLFINISSISALDIGGRSGGISMVDKKNFLESSKLV